MNGFIEQNQFEEILRSAIIVGIAGRRGTSLPLWLVMLYEGAVCAIALARGVSPKKFLEEEIASAPDEESWEQIKQVCMDNFSDLAREYAQAVEKLRTGKEK